MQLQVPENLRPTIYFEDSFEGEKSNQYSSYIDGIRGLITGYQGTIPRFRDYEPLKQVHNFVNDMRMQTNNRVNINALDSWKRDVYPILVVDSDGMNPEKISPRLSMKQFRWGPSYLRIRGVKKPSTRDAEAKILSDTCLIG